MIEAVFSLCVLIFEFAVAMLTAVAGARIGTRLLDHLNHLLLVVRLW